uniref:BEACH domain-containing protein n=1 Tax=Trichobilharzia regenti TaxID=157069 RepID=A0AA85JM88_TRIRE|nr:unnamed protein product [Trichobilharzia regenti]
MLWPSSIHSDDESLNQAKSISSDIPTDSTNHIISDSSNTVSDSNTLALSTWICLHGRLRDNKPRPKFTQLSEMDLFHHVECNHLQHLVSLDMKREYSETGSVPECQSSTEQDDSLHSASNSTNNLSLQIWISSMYACIYLRMVQCSAENRGQIILLGDLCLDFPIKKKIHQQWNHLFLFIQWFDTFNAKVYLIINGWFECIGDLSVDKDIARRTFCQQYQCTLPIVYYGHITDNYSLNCRKYYFQLGNLFLFAGIPSIDQWTIYSSKGFFRHNRKSHHNDDSNNNVKWIAMSFTLLGPCWTGCFDSIECGSRYRNYATCILQALVRRYASAMNDVGQLLSQILLKTNSLITSKKWLHFVKVSCSENLFIMLLSKNSSFLQFIMPVRRLQASTTMKMSKCSVLSPTEIIDGDDYDHNDNGDAFILCDIYNIHHSDNSHSYNKQNSSKSYRNEIYAESISRKRLWTIKKLYASSNDNIDHNEQSSSSIDSSAFYFITHFDASFEPHGGIEVPIHLLGELVCQSHDVILIADCLKLLFTMLQNSSTMFAQFHTPALSHPGTEIPIEKYSKVWLKNLKCPPGFKPAPLSFGHCLLARLFKHPHFNTTLPNFYMIMEVLFNQIVFKFTNSNITSKSKQQYLRLFIDPGLLRCILLFSPRTFWYPPVEQSPEFSANHFNSLLLSTNRSIFKYGLIPGIFEILMNSNEMYSSDSIIITLYNLYTLDKWQLIMASVTGFREAFLEDNPATGEAVVINQQVLAQYTQNWPIQTLTNFIKNRLSLLVIGGINEVTTGKSAESVCDYRFHAKGDKNIIRNGRHFEYISGFLHSKRSCLLNLCRSIISLDANMYLSAAEKVFYTIHDDIDDGNHAYFHQSGQRKQTNTTKQSATTSSSSKLNDNWIFWHQTTRKCLNYSERLKVWRYLSTAEQPATSANSMTNRKSSLKTIDDSCMANETIHSDILDTGLLSNALDNNYESVELQAQRHLQFSSEDEIKSSVIKSTTDTMKVISDSGVSISSLPDSGVDGSNPVKSGNSDCDLSKDTTSVRINETGGTNKPSKTDYTNERLLDCVRIRVEQNAELSALLIKCLDDLWHKCFPIELLYKKYMKNKGKPTFSTIKMENEAEKRTMAGVELSSSSSSSKCRTAKERRINILKENFYQSNDWYSFEVRSNYALLSNVTDSSVSSTGYALIRPPLWLIYSLFRHPNLSLRESALSGYCVWLHFEANKWIKRCKQLYKNFNQSVYFDCSPPTNCTVGANTKAYTTVPPHLSRVRVFTTGLLSPTSPLWCVSDSNMKTDFKLYNNRHLCSVKLLNRAFGLILHGSGKFTAMNEFKMMSKEQSSLFTTNLFMVNNTCSLESLHQDETGFISEPVFHRRSQNSSNDHTSRRIPNNFTCTELSNSDNHNVNGENECKDAHFHKYYLLSTFPVLYSLLIGCFVDAILSCIVKAEANSTNQQYSGDNDNNTDNDVCDNDTTSEIELCTNGLNVLIIILQDSDKCILSTAVKSGLLPVVFNLAWLLEFGVNKVNALEGNNNLCIVPALMPILTSLSRLASRITSWLLMDEKFTSPNDRVFRFQSVVAFVKHLIAMNCVLSDNDAGDNNTSETTTELQLNPGPVSRCLVRRVLYSILETSTNHLDKVGNQIEELFSQENENKEKENNLLNNLSEQTNHLREELKLRYDQLKWILNCIVNVLIYSAYRDEEMIALMTEFSSTYEISSREFSRVSTPPSTSQLRDQNEITYRSISRTFAPPPTSRYSYPYHDFVHSEQYPSSNILRHSTHLPPVLPSSFTSSSSSSASSRLHNDMLSNQKIRTYLLSTKGSNSFLSMQQSLEQALVTSMFTTALQIKNSVTLKIPKISNFLTTNDFMNLFTKSLSRILISRTQLPEAGVSVDFLVTYLLKLFNEETGLLNLCLAVLPPMYSPTFWSNLISVQYWLSRNVKPMSTFLTNISSSNQNINNSNNINDSVNHQMNIENATSESCLLNFHIVKQLTQLHNILNALLTVHFNADSSTLPIEICQTQNLPAYSLFLSSSSSPSISLTSCVRSKTILVTRSEIFTYRELIIIAYRKAKDQWKISLSNLNEAMNSKLSIDNNDLINHDKKSILDQLIQMFWSKSTSTKSNLDDDEKKFAGNEETPSSSNQLSFFIPSHSRLPRKFSIARLAGQARKQCVEGHNAWMDAYSERRRIVGPLGTILWARLAENISHNRGLFYHPESSPSGWCVDPVEGSLRQHYRFYYTHLPIAERLIHSSSRSNLSSNRQPHCLASLIGLPEFNQPPPVGAACTWSDLPLCLPLPAIPLIQLASASRYHIKAVWACRLVGLLHIPPVEGDLVLGQSWLRFQPDPVISNNNNNNNNNMQFTEIESLYPYQSPSNRLWFAWSLKSIDHIEERRYSLRDVAVEIFPDETDVNTPMLFAMQSTKDRDNFIKTISPLIGHHHYHHSLYQSVNIYEPEDNKPDSPNQHHYFRASLFYHQRQYRLKGIQQAWINGELSNFAYLMELNSAAGRSYNDLMQYPIFPWIIRDYESTVLDLTQPTTFRLLNRPIAIQDDERAKAVAARFNETELELKYSPTGHTETISSKSKPSDLLPPYHYPAHCSNEAIVLHYLIRLPPYTFRHLRFQDNNFDVPDRLFHSVATTWRLVTTSVSCVKELVPEFYFQPEVFINRSGLKLGYRQPGDSVDCVELPPWCKNDPRLFTLICRAALESDYVSMNLSHWIDLLFGFKQTGENAKNALNLYHPYTYFGAIDVDTITDPLLAQAVEAMISNYGQTPKQLFRKHPHPYRQLSISNEEVLNYSPKFDNISAESLLLLTESHENDDRRSTYHSDDIDGKLLQTTFSSRLDNTPLETVIGLKWGTWAGSPQVGSFELFWKKQLIMGTTPTENNSLPFIGHLTGSVWCEFSEQTSTVNPNSNNNNNSPNQLDRISSLTCNKLYHSWDGWVDFNIEHTTSKCLFNIKSPSSLPSSSSSSLTSPGTSSTFCINNQFVWYWKILLCESTSRLWISLLPDVHTTTTNSNNSKERLVPYLIKLNTSSIIDNKTVSITMKRLNKNSTESDNPAGIDYTTDVHQAYKGINLQLPYSCIQLTNDPKDLITSLAVSPCSSQGIQLFIGTCFGSIYARQLPINLMDISDVNGWLPQNYQDISVWNTNNPRVLYDIKKRRKKTKININYSKLLNNNNNNDSGNNSRNGHSDLDVKEAGLWEITGWKQLIGHTGCEITVLVINRNNSLIASGDDQGQVCLWDRYRLSLIKTINTNICSSNTCTTSNSNSDDNSNNNNNNQNDSEHLPNESACNPQASKQSADRNDGSGEDNSNSTSRQHSSTRSSSCNSPTEFINTNNDSVLNNFKRVDGICFSLTSGELVIAKWNYHNYHVCWLGVYSCSGVRIATRILDFMAEINDSLQEIPYLQTPEVHFPVPMAFSSVSEGRGVNCLLIGGPGGRLVWLNSWTLDTVRTYLLPNNTMNSRIISLCFGPLASTYSNTYQLSSKDLGEILCQGLYVLDQTGCLYHFGPKCGLHRRTVSEDTSLNSDNLCKQSVAFWLNT